MSWMNWAVPLATGLLGANASKKGTETTQQEKMDPRMDRYVYGPDGNSGLLNSAFGLMQDQMKTGGLNDMQRQGMDMQRQFLMSPQYQQGYGNMMGLGQGLMGGGIAGNPFTGGQRTTMGQANPFQYQNLSNAQLPDYSGAKPQMVQPAAAQAPTPTQPGQSGSGNGQINFGGGGGSDLGGQGISNEGIQAALTAMSLSENPAIRALFPTIAALLGVGGRLGADAQINGLSAAGDKLGNVGSPTDPGPGGLLGMGTISDADGNVRSITTPGMIDAADQATFGPTVNKALFGPGGALGGLGGTTRGGNTYGSGGTGTAQGISGRANAGVSGGFSGGGGLGMKSGGGLGLR
jgi:hypothetical protein